MSAEHSPLPWKWTPCETEDGEPVSGAQLVRCDGKPVWSVDCGDYMGLSDTDAEFIVRACNVHDELVAALRALKHIAARNLCDDESCDCITSRVFADVVAALAKAEGREAVTK